MKGQLDEKKLLYRNLELLSYIIISFNVALITFLKSENLSLQVWAKYLYSINYKYGIIKRGLIGEVFNILNFIKPDVIVGVYHSILLTFIFFLCVFIANRIAKLRVTYTKIILFLINLVFLSSSFFSTLSYNTGYPDLFIFINSFLIIIALEKNYFILSSVLAIIGVLTHEIFIFEIIPVYVLVYYIFKIDWKYLLANFILIFFVFLIINNQNYGHLYELLKNKMHTFNYDFNYVNSIVNVQFGQTIISALKNMINLIRGHFSIFLFNLFFYLFETMVYFKVIPNNYLNKLFFVIVSYSFLIVFMFAWDISRLLQYCLFNSYLFAFYLFLEYDIKKVTSITTYINSFLLLIIFLYNLLSLFPYSYLDSYIFMKGNSYISNFFAYTTFTEFNAKLFQKVYFDNKYEINLNRIFVGPSGLKSQEGIYVKSSSKDNLITYGPYLQLPKGKYELRVYSNKPSLLNKCLSINIVNQSFQSLKESLMDSNGVVLFNNENNLDTIEIWLRRKDKRHNECKNLIIKKYIIKALK